MKWILLSALVFLTACASIVQPTTFMIETNSISGIGADLKKQYMLLPLNENLTFDDLEFSEYALHVAFALEQQGYEIAEGEPEVVIVLDYGIGDAQTKNYSYSVPTFGQTGSIGSTTYGSISSTGNISATTTNIPTYGITGSNSYSSSYDVYTRYINIMAFDNKEIDQSGKAKQLWITKVKSTGTSNDLRRVFPIMMSMASKYLGKDTGQTMKDSVTENSSIVMNFKNRIKAK
mgnify:CR=1 FL=1|jgi:hypothetical protein